MVSQRALIIGGSGGIGRSIANLLAASGYSLIIHGKSEIKIQQICAELGQLTDCTPLPFDLEKNEPDSFMSEIDRIGPIDIVVFSFGPIIEKSLLDMTLDDWQKMALFNFSLPSAVTTHLLNNMKRKKFGRIIFFGGTSTESTRAFKKTAAYAAAKSALNIIVKSIASEYNDINITANLICPGLVVTEYNEDDMNLRFSRIYPDSEFIKPEEIADLVLYMIRHSNMNGCIINWDGGKKP